jgi:hypothetical protein
MLIINSSLVVPHNLIHKCKHALVNKGFKVFINKTKQHKNIYIYIYIYIYIKKKQTRPHKFINFEKQKIKKLKK